MILEETFFRAFGEQFGPRISYMIPMKKRFSFPISEAKGRDSEDSANKCCPWNGDPIQEVHMRRGDIQIETE